MSYLVNKYADADPVKESLYPKDPELRANVDRLLFFDIGSLYKNIVDYFVSRYGLTCNYSQWCSIKSSYIVNCTSILFCTAFRQCKLLSNSISKSFDSAGRKMKELTFFLHFSPEAQIFGYGVVPACIVL
jgi:hypothetical protein